MKIIKRKLLSMLALMLCMGAMLFVGATTAYAADIQVEMNDISMEDVWIADDTLYISISNEGDDEPQILEFYLPDYATPDDEYVNIQAVDAEGHIVNAVQIDNPFYVPQPDSVVEDNINIVMIDNDIIDETLPEGANPTGDGRPFTPDGTGTVVDNATDGDGKEFFTIETPDGNIFYIVIDRQRSTDNVYLLNTVTESELMALAEKSGTPVNNVNSGAVTDPNQSDEQNTPIPPSPEPEATKSAGSSISVNILIIIAIVVIGGTVYYFKIVRPKQLGGDSYDEEDEQEDFDEDFDEDEELDMTNNTDYEDSEK